MMHRDTQVMGLSELLTRSYRNYGVIEGYKVSDNRRI